MNKEKIMNWNTVIMAVMFPLLLLDIQRVVTRVDNAHDDVISVREELKAVKASMIDRKEFDAVSADIKLRQASLEIRIATIELDLSKLKK